VIRLMLLALVALLVNAQPAAHSVPTLSTVNGITESWWPYPLYNPLPGIPDSDLQHGVAVQIQVPDLEFTQFQIMLTYTDSEGLTHRSMKTVDRNDNQWGWTSILFPVGVIGNLIGLTVTPLLPNQTASFTN